MLFLSILAFILLLSMSFFFSGYEVGLISLDRLLLEREAREGGTKEKIARMMKKPEFIFGTTLIGNNIVNVCISALSVVIWNAYGFEQRLGVSDEIGVLITVVIVLIFGEIIPKALFRDKPTTMVYSLFPLFSFFNWLFRPLIGLVGLFRQLLIRVFRLPSQTDLHYLTREDFSYMLIEGQDNDELMEDQREMLEEVFEFKDLRARNIMIPRTDIIAIDKTTPIDKVVDLARQEGFTRYPVYDSDLDHIVGILIVYDLIQLEPGKQTAADVMRNVSFVPENMDVSTLLKEMKTKRKSMMIVVDSYGGTAGLVTVEDILEEVVGDIEDEYDADDEEEDDIRRIDENTWELKGYVNVDDLNDEFDLELPTGDGYETVAGLVIHLAGRIPPKSHVCEVGEYTLRITAASKRKIFSVELKREPAPLGQDNL